MKFTEMLKVREQLNEAYQTKIHLLTPEEWSDQYKNVGQSPVSGGKEYSEFTIVSEGLLIAKFGNGYHIESYGRANQTVSSINLTKKELQELLKHQK